MKNENIINKCKGFQWDSGNLAKSQEKHNILPTESEQIFFRQPLVVIDGEDHKSKEKRFYALGRTDLDKELFVVFTIRINLIRVISSRPMSRKERGHYAQYKKTDT